MSFSVDKTGGATPDPDPFGLVTVTIAIATNGVSAQGTNCDISYLQFIHPVISVTETRFCGGTLNLVAGAAANDDGVVAFTGLPFQVNLGSVTPAANSASTGFKLIYSMTGC